MVGDDAEEWGRWLLGAGEITKCCDARLWTVSKWGDERRDTPNHIPTPHCEKGVL